MTIIDFLFIAFCEMTTAALQLVCEISRYYQKSFMYNMSENILWNPSFFYDKDIKQFFVFAGIIAYKIKNYNQNSVDSANSYLLQSNVTIL